MREIQPVVDNQGRKWAWKPAIPKPIDGGFVINLDGRWLHDGREASSKPDVERAKHDGTLCGDPMIAGAACNYPMGEIIDYFCLACGSSFAAHGDEDNCWRVLKTDDELARYDQAMEIANAIRG